MKLSIIIIATWCMAFTAKAQAVWQEVYNGPNSNQYCFAGSAGNGTVYSLTGSFTGQSTFLRSGSDGAPGTWQQIQLPQAGNQRFVFTANGSDIYLYSDSTYWWSGNYGNNWTPLSYIPVHSSRYPDFHFLPFGNVVLSATDTQLYRSTDHGASWTKVLNWQPMTPNDWFPGWKVSVIQNGGDTYAFVHKDIYKSTDLGANWTKLNTALPRGYPYAVGLLSTDSFLTVNDNGVYTSADAITWNKKVITGFPVKPNFSLSMVRSWKSDSLVLLRHDTMNSHLGEIYCSPDGGNTWLNFESGITDTVLTYISFNNAWDLFISDRGYVFTFGLAGGIYRTKKQFSLSVDEGVATLAGVKVYPNPVSDKLIIENLVTDTRLVLLNMLGQQVYEEVVNAGRTEINTSQLPAGNYILQLTEPDGKRSVVKVQKE